MRMGSGRGGRGGSAGAGLGIRRGGGCATVKGQGWGAGATWIWIVSSALGLLGRLISTRSTRQSTDVGETPVTYSGRPAPH